jgi:hypothetical protein
MTDDIGVITNDLELHYTVADDLTLHLAVELQIGALMRT